MAKPYRLKDLQEERGSLENLIPELVNELGSQKEAANRLGVSATTISNWLRDNGYIQKSIYVKPENSKGEAL